jgi:alpha-tubulin suppressor-like RCC1 family protein
LLWFLFSSFIFLGSNTNSECGNWLDCKTTACVYGAPDTFTSPAVQVHAGSRFSFVLFENGEIYSSGTNEYGYLGTGTTQNPITTPRKVLGSIVGKQITKLVSGSYHRFAQDINGKLYCWGGNWNGELGIGSFDGQLESIEFTTNVFTEKVISITTPQSVTIMITESHKIYAM